MIIVTGATGQLGAQIVQHLLDRVPADQVGVSVRNPDRAADLAARGVRVRRGDYTDPGSLATAFEGAEQVLVISSNATDGTALAQHKTALDAARDAGAQRVLYTSQLASSPDSLFAPIPDHAATEEHLAGLGIPWTSLRNGFYATTVPYLLGAALKTGELVTPADGPVSWTSHADLAEATALILHTHHLDGITPPLTAGEAPDLEQVAATLSELTGRTIRRVVADDEEWAADLTRHGVPEWRVRFQLGLFQAARRGEFAAVDPTLATLLGREPTTIRPILEEAVAGQ